MNKHFLGLFCIFLLGGSGVRSASAFLKEGGHGTGGGGDACEARIDDIRADLKSWVARGGPANLNLSAADVTTYSRVMGDFLRRGYVRLECKKEKKDNSNPVRVDQTAKTCRSVPSTNGQGHRITCDFDKFYLNTSAPDQYRLIHHEFAGLTGFEKNDGAMSDYQISNQITDFLRPARILKLAVTRSTAGYIYGDVNDGNSFSLKARSVLFGLMKRNFSMVNDDIFRENRTSLASMNVANAIKSHLGNLGTRRIEFITDEGTGTDYNVRVHAYDEGTNSEIMTILFTASFYWLRSDEFLAQKVSSISLRNGRDVLEILK